MKNFILILAVLATCLNAEQVNVLTTFYVNQQQFSEDIVCTDCVEPITIRAEGLPDFMVLNGTTLTATAPPVPGQYHVSLNIEDGAGQTARVLVVLLCQDNQTGTQTGTTTQRPGDAIISIYSPQLLANLTTLLLNPNTLTQTEVRIQTILARQAAINNKIANLLILIRRYTSTGSQKQKDISRITLEIEQLLPRQSQINEQLLNLEGELSQNRQRIQQLIDFIKQTRLEIDNERQNKINFEKQYQVALNETHSKNSRKNELEAVIQLRKQILANLTSGTGTGECQQDAIDEQNRLITSYDDENNQLVILLANANDEIENQNSIIDDLKNKLAEAERKRDEAYQNRYEFLGNITTLEKLKESALNKLKELQDRCDQVTGADPEVIARLQAIIDQLEAELLTVETDLGQLEPRLSELQTSVEETQSSINFKASTLDQAINDLQSLYDQNDQITLRTSELKAQKEELDKQIEQIKLTLEQALRDTNTNNQALKNAKEQLAVALKEKEENDAEIQNLLYTNLDIIRSVQGLGSYTFDINKITQIIGFNAQNLDFTNIHPAIHVKEGSQGCVNDVNFYGIGQIKSVEAGKIIIVNSQGDEVQLLTPECSINMATQENYTPKEGDAICWKGHRLDGEWIISESIIIPSTN